MPTLVNGGGSATAGVTTGERLMTSSVSRSAGEAAAVEEKSAFVCSSIVTPTGADDTFVRIANTGVYDLIVTKITASAAGAETFEVQTAANYTSATSHTDLVASPRYAGSTSTFVLLGGTYEGDVDITGDSGAVAVGNLGCGVAQTQSELDLHGSEIVIPTGYSLLLTSTTGAVALTTNVYCHFDLVPRADA